MNKIHNSQYLWNLETQNVNQIKTEIYAEKYAWKNAEINDLQHDSKKNY